MTSKFRHLLAGVVAVASVCAASSSHAQTIFSGYGETNFNYGGAPTVTIVKPIGGSEGTLSNDFVTTLSPNLSGNPVTATLDTYCIDIYHNNNQGGPYQGVSLIEGSSFSADGRDTGYGAGSTAYELQGLGRAAWLVNAFSTLQGVDKVALQLAIWKAEYEGQSDTANYTNLTVGTLHYTDMSGFAQAQLDDAVGYLKASVFAGGGTNYAIGIGTWVSYQGNAQDQIIDPKFNPVPEPASMAMCATALVGLTGAAARRKRKALAAQA